MALDLILVNCIQRNSDGSLSRSPQLGLVYIATTLRDAGYKSLILAGDDVLGDLLDAVNESETRPLVGFYLNSDNRHDVLRLASVLNGQCPGTNVIVGGPEPNVEPDVWVSLPVIDYACSGDGEHLLLDLLSSLKTGGPALSQIPGLTYKSSTGEVVRNPPRPPLGQLDSLPIPDRSLYPSQSDEIKSQLVTSRGCGFRCTFCFESTNRRYRAHSPERVVEEMLRLQEKYGTTYFSFVDDIFSQHPRRIEQICELMQKHFRPHENLFWYCEARVDIHEKLPHLLPLMKESGLTRIQIGTESGSQKVIDAYKKHINIDQIYATVQQCQDSKLLSVFTNFILGGALDDEETYAETLQLVKNLIHMAPGRFECNTSFLSPYPGTDIYNRPSAYGIRILDAPFETGLSDDYIFAETESLSKSRILEMEREFKGAVLREMLEVIPSLSSDLMLEHLSMNHHKLRTQWSDIFRSDSIISNCSALLCCDNYQRMASVSDCSLMPMRTFSLRQLRKGVLPWPLRRRVIDFNDYELFLLERCSGKLTIKQIIDRASAYWDNEVDRDQLTQGILSFLGALSDELMLVFRSYTNKRRRNAKASSRNIARTSVLSVYPS